MHRFWRQLAIATNWPVLVAIAVLCAMGLVSIWAFSQTNPQYAGAARKQLLFLGGGAGLMLAIQGISYLRVGQWSYPFYIVSLLLLIYTLIPGAPGMRGVGGSIGVKAWISFGAFKLQPSEITKIAFCMALARYLRFRSNYRTLSGLLPPFALAVTPVLLILRQPDLGTAMIFFPGLFVVLYAAGAKGKHLLGILLIAVALSPLAWLAGPAPEAPGLPVLRHLPALIKKYQRDRLTAMFSRDPNVLRETGFQQEHALTAFGSGGFAGRGAMNIPVGSSVPEAHNDMVFALIGEQFGFIGATIVVAAYVVLFTAGIEIAAATKEPFGRLVAIGIISLLAGQTFLNLLVSVRLMPVTGITLPFVSYGGSSLLASFLAAGLLLNIGQNRPLVIARASFEYD